MQVNVVALAQVILSYCIHMTHKLENIISLICIYIYDNEWTSLIHQISRLTNCQFQPATNFVLTT